MVDWLHKMQEEMKRNQKRGATMTEKTESFSPQDRQIKTYSLVELVKAPTTMVDHGPDDSIFAFPVVAILELILTLGVILALLLMSFTINAPLEDLANPTTTTDPAKAPWYFMGLQEMLEHGHPTLMGVLMPTLIVLFVIAIPYLDNSPIGTGTWFTSKRGKRITLITALYVLVVMPLYILLDTSFPIRDIFRGQLPDFVLNAIVPALIMAVIVLLPLLVLMRYKPNAREVVLVLFTVLFTSAIVFTVTGFLFRGPGFELYWPWNMPGGYSPWDNL
jgi:menaquinol-cytochrome c reductase cytochrome b/c subunit